MEKLDEANSILGSVQSIDRMRFDMHNTSYLQELGGAPQGMKCPEKVRVGNMLLEVLSSQVWNSGISQSARETAFPAETLNVFPDRTSNLALLQMLEGIGIDREGAPCFTDGLQGHLPTLEQVEHQPGFQQLLGFPFSSKPDTHCFDHIATRDEFRPDYDLNISASGRLGRPNYLLQREVQLFEPESCITHVNSESGSLVKTEAKDQFSSLDAPEEGASSANQERNSSNTANSSENCNDRKSNAPSQEVRERRKRKRSKACKNSEEVESQRMTHIAVERNRRKQMNEHLNVLRSLMPGSFIQRGDQASIIGGAIDFVKELEQLLQSLQARKRRRQCEEEGSYGPITSAIPVFNGFFLSPQYTSYSTQWNAKCIMDNNQKLDPTAVELTAENKSAVADIEVTVIETHANLKILSQKRPGQLLKTIAALENLHMTILHLNITTIDHSVLYSFNVKIEEECQLSSADEMATAVHQIISMIHTDNQVNSC